MYDICRFFPDAINYTYHVLCDKFDKKGKWSEKGKFYYNVYM